MDNLISIFQNQVLNALGWTLLHSIWQAFIVLTILQIIRAQKSIKALINYRAALYSLFSMVLMSVGTFFYYYFTIIPGQDTTMLSKIYIDSSNMLHWPVLQLAKGELTLADLLQHNMDLIVLAWCVGIFLFAIRFVLNLGYLHRLRNVSVEPLDAFWVERVRLISEELGLKRGVQILRSGLVRVPATFGYFKPIILIPTSLIAEMGAYELEAIILHEMAHIKRNDYIINIAQSLIETLLFFNPFIWWMSAIIKKERENCCDDFVISRFDSLSYVKALAQVEEFRLGSEALVMAATGNKNQLLNRIKRIMENKVKRRNNWNKVTAGIILLAVALSVSWISPKKGLEKRKDELVSVMEDIQDRVENLTENISGYVDSDATNGSGTADEEEDRIVEEMEEILEERVNEFIQDGDSTKRDSISKAIAKQLEKELEDVRKLLSSDEFEKLKNADSEEEMAELLEEMQSVLEDAGEELEDQENGGLNNQFFNFSYGNRIDSSNRWILKGDSLMSIYLKDGDMRIFIPDSVNNFEFEFKEGDFDFEFGNGNNLWFGIDGEDDKDDNIFFYKGNNGSYNYNYLFDGKNKKELFEEVEDKEELKEMMRESREEYKEAMKEHAEQMKERKEEWKEYQRELQEEQRERMLELAELMKEQQREMEEDKADLLRDMEDDQNHFETMRDEQNDMLNDAEEMLLDDGLIQNTKRYSFQYTKKGMKVNGEKVDSDTFKHYKKLFGNLDVNVSKHKNSSTISITD